MKRILLFALLTVTVLMANAQDKWYQYGVKIGTSFPTVREYSVNGDFLSGSGNADFGVFFRAGRYVFGEVGFGYTFLKGVYYLSAVGEDCGQQHRIQQEVPEHQSGVCHWRF